MIDNYADRIATSAAKDSVPWRLVTPAAADGLAARYGAGVRFAGSEELRLRDVAPKGKSRMTTTTRATLDDIRSAVGVNWYGMEQGLAGPTPAELAAMVGHGVTFRRLPVAWDTRRRRSTRCYGPRTPPVHSSAWRSTPTGRTRPAA